MTDISVHSAMILFSVNHCHHMIVSLLHINEIMHCRVDHFILATVTVCHSFTLPLQQILPTRYFTTYQTAFVELFSDFTLLSVPFLLVQIFVAR